MEGNGLLYLRTQSAESLVVCGRQGLSVLLMQILLVSLSVLTDASENESSCFTAVSTPFNRNLVCCHLK